MGATVVCPHCGGVVVIEAVNCGIFRHGTFKASGRQIPPHARKAECDRWAERGEIYGCGKPFRVSRDVSGATMCDYI